MRVLIVFDDIIGDIQSNKKLSPIVTELFLRGTKLYILLVFISQSYFEVPKTIKINAINYFTMKILSKRELQRIASNQLSDNDLKISRNSVKIIL